MEVVQMVTPLTSLQITVQMVAIVLVGPKPVMISLRSFVVSAFGTRSRDSRSCRSCRKRSKTKTARERSVRRRRRNSRRKRRSLRSNRGLPRVVRRGVQVTPQMEEALLVGVRVLNSSSSKERGNLLRRLSMCREYRRLR
jgi:hypothetical protein